MILSGYLIFNAIIFCISLFGIVLNYQNILSLLIYIQLMLLAINSNFVIFAKLWNNVYGQIWGLFIFSVMTIELIIILIILLKLFKLTGTIQFTNQYSHTPRTE